MDGNQVRDSIRPAGQPAEAATASAGRAGGDGDGDGDGAARGQPSYDSDSRSRAIVNTTVDGILTIDDHGIIEWLNPAAQRIFGYSSQELIGRNVKMLMPSPYHEEHDQYLANYRDTGQRKIIGIGREVVGRRKDGSTFPLDLAVSEVQLENRRIFTGIIRDITEQKQMEAQLLRAREAAEAANRVKDRFFALLSHELRTPLNSALLAVQKLQTDPTLSVDQRQWVEMIRASMELETRLTDDLLDVTRITNGKLEMHFEPLDLHPTVRRAIDICRDDLTSKQLMLSQELKADLHLVRADATRIQQVLWNLLKNAAKFTPVGGRITLRTFNPSPQQVAVEVQDDGIGIEPEMLDRIFDAFEQGGKDMTRRFGGLGLGLAISKGLVEAHGGTLTAHSEGKDRGTTFTVRLPIAKPALLPSPRRPGSSDGNGEAKIQPRWLKILLVEDHKDSAMILARLLRMKEGHEVQIAGGSAAGLEAAGHDGFDLMLIDLSLPDGSGADLLRQLRDRGNRIPGVVLSGYGREEDVQQSLDAGFAAHLTKPINFDVLNKTISAVMARAVPAERV